MSGEKLYSFTLQCSLKRLVGIGCGVNLNNNESSNQLNKFYEHYLKSGLKEKNINISKWDKLQSDQTNEYKNFGLAYEKTHVNTSDIILLKRNIQAQHPPKVKFPGLPSYADAFRAQLISMRKSDFNELCKSTGVDGQTNVNDTEVVLRMDEVAYFEGIPYSDYFQVHSSWLLYQQKDGLKVEVYLFVKFEKSTWLKWQIDSNTKQESKESVEIFETMIKEWKEELNNDNDEEKSSLPISFPNLNNNINENENNNIDDFDENDFFDAEEYDETDILLESYGRDRKLKEETDHAKTELFEAMQVIIEYIWWKLHNTFFTDIPNFFNIPSNLLFNRIISFYLPNKQWKLIKKPDLYVPLLTVFTLPQVMLLAVDIDQHGCTRETLLGSSLGVSVGTWVTHSFIYYIICFLLSRHLSKGLRFIESLSCTGYGMINWCLGILIGHICSTTFAMENYIIEYILFFFGGGSGLLMALFFISALSANRKEEYLDPLYILDSNNNNDNKLYDDEDDIEYDNFLDAKEDESDIESDLLLNKKNNNLVDIELGNMRNRGINENKETLLKQWNVNDDERLELFADVNKKRQINKKYTCWFIIQRISLLLIVIILHYQFLRYIYFVFLPGKRRLCRFASVANPDFISKLLSQKNFKKVTSLIN